MQDREREGIKRERERIKESEKKGIRERKKKTTERNSVWLTFNMSLGKSRPSLSPSRFTMNCVQDILFPTFCRRTVRHAQNPDLSDYTAAAIYKTQSKNTDGRQTLKYPRKRVTTTERLLSQSV